MKITILFLAHAPAGKVADAELHFTDGPLAGLKLVGFSIWERRQGGHNVTFPARSYSVNGERRTFALLRPAGDTQAQQALAAQILDAFHAQQQTALVREFGAPAR